MVLEPTGLAVAPDLSYALITEAGGGTVRRLDLAAGGNYTVTTVAGWNATKAAPQASVGDVDGAGAAATFDTPTALSIADTGTFALIADAGSRKLRRVIRATG